MFKFKLALALGRTVAEIDQTMTSTELSYWMVFYALHPFGPERDNLHAAIIASTLANVNRGKNQPAFSAEDFMIKNQHEKRSAETKNVLAFFAAHAVKKDG